MRYISLFSGIGGLESPIHKPILACEIDEDCHPVIERRLQADVVADVSMLHPPRADLVTGGWPCQDISVAGDRAGLTGDRSGLFFEMVRVAQEAHASTIIAENVPNLLRLDSGRAFEWVLETFAEAGFPNVAWRTLNARAFGLPHQRRRVFIIASTDYDTAAALHRPIPTFEADHSAIRADGFYWTAGLQSINYSHGFVPTLKVGSSLSIPSPPAVFVEGLVRKITAEEALVLQGFDPSEFEAVSSKAIHRMVGNAVARPVGEWVMSTPDVNESPEFHVSSFGAITPSGVYSDGEILGIQHAEPQLATNLGSFLDLTISEPLSVRAATGLLSRLRRSGKPCPNELRDALERAAVESEPLTKEDLVKAFDALTGTDNAMQ